MSTAARIASPWGTGSALAATTTSSGQVSCAYAFSKWSSRSAASLATRCSSAKESRTSIAKAVTTRDSRRVTGLSSCA